MAWQTPRTWVDGETVDQDLLNQDVRDNISALSTHAHGGGGGDGDDVLDGVDYIDLDHIAGPGAAESGQTRFFGKSDGSVYVHPNGGSEVALSEDGHTHTTDEVQGTDTSNPPITTPASAGSTGLGASYTDLSSDSLTVTDTNSCVVIVGAMEAFNGTGNSDGHTAFMRILTDAVQQAEFGASAQIDDTERVMFVEHFTDTGLTAASHTFKIQGKTVGGTGGLTSRSYGISAVEVLTS